MLNQQKAIASGLEAIAVFHPGRVQTLVGSTVHALVWCASWVWKDAWRHYLEALAVKLQTLTHVGPPVCDAAP